MNRITRAIATFTLVSVLAVAPAATAAPSLASETSGAETTKSRQPEQVSVEDISERQVGIEAALSEFDYESHEELFESLIEDFELEEADIPSPQENPSNLYGAPIPEDVAIKVAKLLAAQELSSPNIDPRDVSIDRIFNAQDALGNDSVYLVNFSAGDSAGYLALSAHTRAPLLLDVSTEATLPDLGSAKYFSSGEIYFVSPDGETVTLTDGSTAVLADFRERQATVAENLGNLPSDLLDQLEYDTTAQIQPYVDGQDIDIVELESKKNYDGQDASGTTSGLYGRISSPTKYIADRYNGYSISSKDSKILGVSKFHMDDYGGKNDCVPIAITRVFDYLRGRGYTSIPSSRATIYKDVLKIAKKWGYTEENGTNPVNIDNIMSEVAKKYGYKKTVTKGIYVWSYKGTIVSEINKNRPLLFNIARGSYKKHTVTATGYRTYTYKAKTLGIPVNYSRPFVAVADSWRTSTRWIDFNQLAYDVFTAGFGSFNTMELKK